MKKIVITFGIIAGLIVSAMMLVSFNLGGFESEYGEVTGYATMIIAFSTIFFAVRSYRDNQLNGTIGFGKAFLVGLYITLIASTLYVITWMIMSETIATNFTENYTNHAIEKINESDLPTEEKEARIAEMHQFAEMYEKPVFKIGMTYIEILPVGLIVSLICAGFLKRKNMITQNA